MRKGVTRKRVQLLGAVILLCIIGLFALASERPRVKMQVDDNNGILLTIKTNGREERLCSWENPIDGKRYFFLPSYVNDNMIYFSKSEKKCITVDGKQMNRHSAFEWENDASYKIAVTDDENNQYDYQIVFMKSGNIPAVFVETESGSMEFLHEDRENKESGHISVFEENGNLEYSGELNWISGRGNSTWNRSKKPYTIDLKKEAALLGMDKGKKWYLLALWYEPTKMNTKIALETATELGLSFTPECMWIDLYLNGEYNGLYLLCETVTVGEGRIEITDLEKENKANNPDIEYASAFEDGYSKGYELEHGENTDGGYLVEKDTVDYYTNEKSGFRTESGAYFTLKSPEHASREQIQYISEYFQAIENMIMDGEPDYDNYIDLDSFAARFLVDEIFVDSDANVASLFFIKDRHSNLLYANPAWDYDLTLSWTTLDYETSVLDKQGIEVLSWFPTLYSDDKFYEQLSADYKEILPHFGVLLDSTIDEYAKFIRDSVQMDTVRWQSADDYKNAHYYYMEFDNSIRYLKYYLAKRLNYLCERWEIPYDEFTISGNGKWHEVTFMCDDTVVETRSVPDGDTLVDLPHLDDEQYEGWYYKYNDEKYSSLLPIYEDSILYAKE